MKRFDVDSLDQLLWRANDSAAWQIVQAVRAFPFSAPRRCTSIVDGQGKECVYIAALDDLSPSERTLVEKALADREFLPQLLRVDSVSSYSTPSRWKVQTNHGPTELVLKGDEDIRRLGDGRLLVSDAHGLQFEVPNLHTLDPVSRRIFDRFM